MWFWHRKTPRVVLVFLQLPTLAPETFSGDDEPLIGAVTSEAEAEQIAAAHPDMRIRWEVVDFHGEQETPSEQVIVVVEGGFFEDVADRSPSPLGVFATMNDAAMWAHREHRSDAATVFWEVPFDVVDTSAPTWPRRRLSDEVHP